MAVVKKERVMFLGNWFQRIVKCSASGTFTCELPPEVAQVNTDSTISGGTYQECVSDWDNAVEEYTNSQKTESKIIAFEFRTEDTFNHGGVNLEIKAEPLIETVTKKPDGSVMYNYERISDEGFPEILLAKCGRGGWEKKSVKNKVPYTTENLAFFQSMALYFERLTKLLDGMSGENVSEIAKQSILALTDGNNQKPRKR